MNAEDFIKLAEYIKENYVPKEGSSDKCCKWSIINTL